MPVRDCSLSCPSADGFLRVAYREWGDQRNPKVLICAHGLTRNSHDFDMIAEALQEEWRVVCPDLPGRGASDWLPATTAYEFPAYLGVMNALLAHVGGESVAWLGTSLGGLLGMLLAAQSNAPIERLILNDIGPVIPRKAVIRVLQAVGGRPTFATAAEAETWFRSGMTTFGPLTDEQWRHVATHGVRQLADGRLGLHYDPRIADGAADPPTADIALWPNWDVLGCSVLTIRGAQSDFLSAETVAAMKSRGPGCEELVVAHTGHAPMLMDAATIGAVAGWARR